MSQTLTQIAQELIATNKKVQLIGDAANLLI